MQATTGHSGSATSLTVTPGSNVTAGDRLVVEVGVWSGASATAASVTDSGGNGYVELLHFKASDKTEMSIWSAPVTGGGGTRPTITVKPSSKADVGAVAIEYAGVSTVADATVVDQSSFSTGKTTSAGSVSPGATQPTTGANELAIGFYLDSGFDDTLGGGPGYTTRANVSPDGDIELLAQDAIAAAGTTPNPSFSTGAATTWLASTVVLKAGESGPPTVPGAPSTVTATAGNTTATVTWTAPPSGNSPITSYTVTPYIGAAAQTPTTLTGSPPATSATVSGLTNGTAYTFTVAATNAVGTGPPSTASNAVTPMLKPGGEWAPLMNWPFVAIHLFLLSTGHVLAFDGWQQPEPTYEWNPTTQALTSATAPDSIFCSGMAQLPNGEVMTVGGYGGLTTGKLGIVDTAIFNPATGTWTRAADMHDPRWYPDLTELANGDYVAISGNSANATTWADTPEVYDPAANTWTLLSKVSTPQVHEEEYPFSYLIPNGNVFTIGPSEDVSYELNVANETWTSTGGSSGITNGSSVMYRPGKILYSGGAPSVTSTTNATANTSVIDLTAATPQWRQIAPMHNARIYHTLTMLANGEVLAAGGEPTSDQGIVTSGVLPTEIWNPATETWTPAAPIAAARNYHSTAMLMPDGTVLLTGGGHPNGSSDPGEFSAQVYSPPYLFNGPRPTIAAAPAAATYNAPITISTPAAASIGAVNLVSLGTDTHQTDMAQHFVPLSFTASSGSLTVQTPASSALAPYGNYMLFIVNKQGVPSLSAPLNLSAAPSAPAAPTGVSATAANGSATVTWTAPASGTSPISSYTVTPYIGASAQAPTTVTGSPPTTSATVSGLTNGTTYTFTVTATNAVGTGPPSAASNPVTPSAPTAPSAPSAVTATSGNASATVTWSAPASNGSSITSYTVTPYIGSSPQPATTVTGSPPASSATVTGLTNGTTYTFTVTATNAIGTGPPSPASNAATPTATAAPAFVQQSSAHAHNVASLAVIPGSSLTAGNRLVVEVGVWSSAKATTSSVKDSAGDTFTELLHFKASDGTELSVWTAPVSAGGGTRPTITATPTATADVGAAVLEYSGLSNEAGAAVLDQSAQATGKTTAAAVVSTAATAPTSAPGELVLGLYADSGFEDTLMGRMGFNGRVNVSPTGEMELLAEDALTGATGATPSASVQTGPATVWLMTTIVFKSAPAAEPPAAPAAAPAHLVAIPANGNATVAWTAPPNGGSPITTYTVTPYAGSRRLKPRMVSGTTAAIGGLRNGASYRFTVAAHNALGKGPVSPLTNGVKPSRTLVSAFWCTPLLMATMRDGPLATSMVASDEIWLPSGRVTIVPAADRRPGRGG
ncbi:MAG TPA: fibronectin type III domain-containing protein [Solirubrobacteraceae bacterium]|nr:fibronectin type III domain-containing protein [Solirubrobacteraceae bacterium]